MHDFLFLPRSHKEVGRNRLPGPGEYCISLYVAAVCYANAPCRRNETRNGMPFRDLPYLPSPIPRSLSVQLAQPPSLSFSRIAFSSHALVLHIGSCNSWELGPHRVLGDTMISHRYAHHESEQPTTNESLEKETTRSNSESWLSFSLSLSLSLSLVTIRQWRVCRKSW